MSRAPLVATYSIAACDLEAGHWGVATQSKFLAVGSVVPWAKPNVGAIATQAYANPRYGPDGLELLASGSGAAEVVERLTAADDGRDHRQLGVVDREGGSATYTGSSCMDWAGGRHGPVLRGAGEHPRLARRRSTRSRTRSTASTGSLAERLIACLAAAQAAGGDRRGQQSAALLVVAHDGGYAGLSDSLVDLRVDDHPAPVEELARLHRIHTAALRQDARHAVARGRRRACGRAAASGSRGSGSTGDLDTAFREWSGRENLEERVDGVERIDPVVLEELRRAE